MPGTFGESLDSEGKPRPIYDDLFRSLDQLGRMEFARRWKQAQRVVRDNGIAYSGYSGNNSRPRTWTLDALPALLSAGEWDKVKRAIAQRGRLLNLVLRDLYGPQELIRNKVLPASLIYSDPRLIRACQNIPLPNDDFLHLYAADIARAPDGGWWITADRTESPSGLGYTLEHRIVMSQMLPKVFQESHVRRLAPFFSKLQETVHRLAHSNRDNPRVVLLSDGPVNPYHLEDAYLARYLGYLLVEDGDLAVRSSRLMLKTLGGLQHVDVVLRHKNAADCDPLVHNNVAGVAGLTQATRRQQVAIANPLGSGIVESAAYMAFSRRLCKALLSEELLLPNVATWWCGEPGSLDYVLANLDRLFVQPAFRRRGLDGRLRERIRSMARDELATAIKKNPFAYAAQERVERSSVPMWGPQLRAQRMAIRCYAVRAEDDFEVMDGGLGRITEDCDQLEVTIRHGEKAKDVWIHADGPVEFTSLLDIEQDSGEVLRSGADLPSRVADNLFWLGRRLVRVEDHARLVHVTARRLIGEVPHRESIELPMLLRYMASEGVIEPGYAMGNLQSTLPQITTSLPRFAFDLDQPGSLLGSVGQLARLGASVRDRLSVQAWQVIQRVEEEFRVEPDRHISIADLLETTDELLMRISALTGILIEGMTRTQTFRFLDLGRRIERSMQILSIVENGVLSSKGAPRRLLEATLQLADSLMTHRSRYLANVHCSGVLDLVLTDETNPRSLAFQIMMAKEHIDQLPREKHQRGLSVEQRIIMNLSSSIQMLDVDTLRPNRLTENASLADWSDQFARLSKAISHRYLVHASPSRQLTDMGD